MTDWKAPGAKLILRATAPREEWLQARTKGIGGSDIGGILGLVPYPNSSPYAIWCDKTSDEAPAELTGDVLWFGNEVEPILAARFTQDTGIETRNVGMYQSKQHEWMLANPDRFTADGGILEIKTTGRFTDNGKAYLAGRVPASHRAQVLWYMAVTGRRTGHVIALVDREVVILSVAFDGSEVERMILAGEAFWQHVIDRTPPPVDYATVTPDEVAARFPEVIDPDAAVESLTPLKAEADHHNLSVLKRDKKEIEDEIKAIETRIKAEIGDREYLTVEGRPLFRWQEVAGRKSFDKAGVLEKIAADRGLEPTKANLAALEAEFTKQGQPTRRLTTITDKEAA